MKINIQHKTAIAIIFACALFLDRLDLMIVNISLPAIAKSFHISIVATNWVSLAFLITMAISISISHWLGQKFGLKPIFITALLFFGIGSLLCTLSPNLGFLILARCIQGIGGGLLIPVGMHLIYQAYDRSEYASITSYTFIPALIAPAIGPFLGGLILETFSWRYIFLLASCICLMLVFTALFYLPRKKPSSAPPFDWFGFILGALLFYDMFIVFSQLEHAQFQNKTSYVYYAFLPILFFLFITREKQSKHPLIDLQLFNNRLFSKAVLIQACFQICHLGGFFLIGIYLQIGAGFSAMYAGIIIGMQAIGAIITSRLSVKLFNQVSRRLPIIIGLSGVAVLSLTILWIQNTAYFMPAIILFLVRGLFSGLCGAPIQTLSVISMNKHDIGKCNALFNICRQVSISLGVALSSLLLTLGITHSTWQAHQPMNAAQIYTIFHQGFFAIAAVALLGILITTTLPTKNKASSMEPKPKV